MAGSGSENRQRQRSLKARFTAAEASLIEDQAARAGVTVAALIRHAVLAQPPLRAARHPPVGRAVAAQLLACLGALAAALRRCEGAGGSAAPSEEIAAIHRDLAELRAVLFQALGRLP